MHRIHVRYIKLIYLGMLSFIVKFRLKILKHINFYEKKALFNLHIL